MVPILLKLLLNTLPNSRLYKWTTALYESEWTHVKLYTLCVHSVSVCVTWMIYSVPVWMLHTYLCGHSVSLVCLVTMNCYFLSVSQ